MKVTYEWLKELVDINKSAQEIADKITMSGLEVEKVVQTGVGDVNVVCVELLEVKKHPDADKLNITRVDAGKFGKKQIITNIQGLQAGQKVLAALEGVELANGLKIKKTKLKGIESEGMFVGWEELNIPQKSEELFFLDLNIENGTNYNDIIPFTDSVIDIELTANRGDCLGMIGIVREIDTLFNAKPIPLSTSYKTTDEKINDLFSVEIKTKNCLRYCGAVIKDIKIEPSPYWMQLRLIKAGVRPINNVVDITNYVLLECNQPLHAFDMDKINDNKIIVRNAFKNEKITTLDDIERELEEQDIIIADNNTGHCMGGVMGGQISEVSDSTKNVFLEAAFFKPEIIRKTSKRTGLRSESSYRFERTIDIENVDFALKRALYWFDKLGAGKISQGIINEYPAKFERRIIKITTDWINNKLGTDISSDKILDILSRLGFEIEKNENDFIIKIPGWRNDITIKEDISEEIARIYGFNNIPHTYYPSSQAATYSDFQKKERKLRQLLYQSGCDEVWNFSFYGNSLFDKMLLPEEHDFRNIYRLGIPLTDDWAGMRTSLIPGMIKTASFNVARKNKSLALFEIGNVNIDNNKEMPDSIAKVSIIYGGFKREKDYCNEIQKYDFFDIKGIAELILDYFQVKSEFIKSNEVFLHPFQQAEILINDQKAGILGKLHPHICDSFDIDVDIFVLELSLDILFSLKQEEIICKDVPKFPSSERDLALLVKNNITAKNIIDCVNEYNIEILQDIKVFDIFKGGNIQDGEYSIAINLKFNKISSTLTDDEVDKAVNKILKNLENKLNAKIR